MGTNADAAPAPSGLNRLLFGRNPKRTLVRVVILVAVACIVRGFVLLPIEVEGPSMLPTYRDRTVHVINRLAYLFHEPQRGDTVAIGLKAGNHVMYLKRIVGLPGEMVAFHQGQLYINNQLVEEPYVKLHGRWELEDVPVGLNEYYVVGDNREMLRRDHEQGRPTRDHILGKLLL
jgi:signal peptidase I